MFWSWVAEVCLGGVIIIKKEEGKKNDTKRTRAKVRTGKPDNGHN